MDDKPIPEEPKATQKRLSTNAGVEISSLSMQYCKLGPDIFNLKIGANPPFLHVLISFLGYFAPF